MKNLLIALFLLSAQAGIAQKTAGETPLKPVLLDELKGTFDNQDWFVPLHQAIAGLTAGQATWKPDDSSHSIVQLVTHLYYWNLRALHAFTGKPDPRDNINNDETFASLKADQWLSIVKKSDSLSQAWEQAVAAHSASLTNDEAQTIAKVSTHNAYHVGQIMYARKQEKAWDSAKGVK